MGISMGNFHGTSWRNKNGTSRVEENMSGELGAGTGLAQNLENGLELGKS